MSPEDRAGLFARHRLVSRRSRAPPDRQLFPNPHPSVRVPDLLNNIGRSAKPGGLGDITFRRTQAAPAGTYESTITVSSDAGDRVELSLSLSVWDFALPAETHLAGNIHTDTEIHNLAPELEVKYYQMIRRHRLAMGVLGYAPDTTVKGSDIQFDWTSYDARLGKYLDGSAYTEKYGYSGPGYGVPTELLILPFDAYPTNDYDNSRHVGWPYGKEWKFYRPWPVEVPKGGVTSEYGEVWKKAFHAFEEHFDQHPAWNRTKPIVFLLSLDESYDDPSIEKMLYYGLWNGPRLKYASMAPIHGHDGPPGDVVDVSILGCAAVPGAHSCAIRAWKIGLHRYGKDGDLGCRALGWVSISGAPRGPSRLFSTSRVDVSETYVEHNGAMCEREDF
jgi:hypothetical protein